MSITSDFNTLLTYIQKNSKDSGEIVHANISGPEDAIKLAKALENNGVVKEISFWGRMGDRGFSALARALEHNNSIVKVVLDACMAGKWDLSDMCTSWNSNINADHRGGPFPEQYNLNPHFNNSMLHYNPLTHSVDSVYYANGLRENQYQTSLDIFTCLKVNQLIADKSNLERATQVCYELMQEDQLPRDLLPIILKYDFLKLTLMKRYENRINRKLLEEKLATLCAMAEQNARRMMNNTASGLTVAFDTAQKREESRQIDQESTVTAGPRRSTRPGETS